MYVILCLWIYEGVCTNTDGNGLVRDTRLLMEGRKRHIAALRFLRRDVKLLRTGTEVEDGVLAAAHTLGHIGVSLPFAPAIVSEDDN